MAAKSHASLLNAQQINLRKQLVEKVPFEQVRPMLLLQHACLHTQAMADNQEWSYQDEVLAGLSYDGMGIVPAGEDHSIAWLIWHLTRCEDITMNLLIAETDQVLIAEGWLELLNVTWRDTGNAMPPEEILDFSRKVDLPNLFAYRLAVGRQTQALIAGLAEDAIYRKINPVGEKRIRDEGAVLEDAWEIAEYWLKRDVAGLMLMPATRHILSHLNEALTVKKEVLKERTK